MASVPLTDTRDLELPASSVAVHSSRLLSAEEAAEPAFRAAWDALVSAACEPNPFFEPWCLLPSIELFGAPDARLLFGYFHNGALVGLMPLAKNARYYQHPLPNLSSWEHENMFCGAPLVAKGHEQSFWHALLDHCDNQAGLALFLHLPSLPADGPLARALADVSAEQSRICAIVQSHERAFLASDSSSEEYFNTSISTKKRKELRRQQRRLGEMGELTFSRISDTSGAAEWADEFIALEKAGWKGEQGSALANGAATNAFFRQTLEGAAEADRLERLTLRLDDQPIAMLANFLTAPGSFSFKTAFDENYARFSPGVLLQQENLALLDRDDIAWCDSCAAADHPMIERIWREKRRVISVSLAIGSTLRRAAFRQLLRLESHENFCGDNS